MSGDYMLPWGEAEIRRATYRISLFQRRGLSESEAEVLADRLALRDYQREDMHVCVECANLQKDGVCFAAAQGRMPGWSRRAQPIKTMLQRCSEFEWQKP